MNWSSIIGYAKEGRKIRREAWEPGRYYTYHINGADAYMSDQDGERTDFIDLDDLDSGDWVAIGREVTVNPAPEWLVGVVNGSFGLAVYREGVDISGTVESITVTYDAENGASVDVVYIPEENQYPPEEEPEPEEG